MTVQEVQTMQERTRRTGFGQSGKVRVNGVKKKQKSSGKEPENREQKGGENSHRNIGQEITGGGSSPERELLQKQKHLRAIDI